MSFFSSIVGIFNKVVRFISKVKKAVNKLLNSDIGQFIYHVIRFVAQKEAELEESGLAGPQKRQKVFEETLAYCKDQSIVYDIKWINLVIELVLLLNEYNLLDFLLK